MKELQYISKNRLSLILLNIQIDNEMKMAYIPEGTFFMGSSDSFHGTK